MIPQTREAANLCLMFGIVFITGAAITLPLGVLLAAVGISASIGFILVGVLFGAGGAWLVTIGRRGLRRLG